MTTCQREPLDFVQTEAECCVERFSGESQAEERAYCLAFADGLQAGVSICYTWELEESGVYEVGSFLSDHCRRKEDRSTGGILKEVDTTNNTVIRTGGFVLEVNCAE